MTDTRTITCLECNGDGYFDSGGTTPWGEWIDIPCERCHGKGTVLVGELTDDEVRFLGTSNLSLAAPDLLAACEAALKYIEDCVEPSCEEGDEREDGTIHDGSTPEGNMLRAAIGKAKP